GLDNGYLRFNNYRIDRKCLLNKNADVSPDGIYQHRIKEKGKRHGTSLGILSAGRVGIIGQTTGNLWIALTIAIRYSAVRKQFGPTESEELPIIDYQMQQWRLFPYLASCFVFRN